MLTKARISCVVKQARRGMFDVILMMNIYTSTTIEPVCVDAELYMTTGPVLPCNFQIPARCSFDSHFHPMQTVSSPELLISLSQVS